MDQQAIWSITPPILALVLAIATRNVLVSLGVGVTLGMIIVNDFHPWLGLVDVFERGIIGQLTEAANAEMLLIILVIGGFVHLMERSGGMAAFARRMTRVVDSPRKAQLSVWGTGMAIFFTDSGNSLILGPMFRPIFARVRVCREKLAFIIDSTSSPVCVLVPIISWGVYIMSLLEQPFASLGVTVSPLQACIGATPFQLYPLLALATVPVLVATGREYGPMARVQRQYLEETAAPEEPREQAAVDDAGGGEAGAGAVLLPLATVLLTLGGLLVYFTVTLGELPYPQLGRDGSPITPIPDLPRYGGSLHGPGQLLPSTPHQGLESRRLVPAPDQSFPLESSHGVTQNNPEEGLRYRDRPGAGSPGGGARVAPSALRRIGHGLVVAVPRAVRRLPER